MSLSMGQVRWDCRSRRKDVFIEISGRTGLKKTPLNGGRLKRMEKVEENGEGLAITGNRVGIDAAVAHVAGAATGGPSFLLTENNAVVSLRYSESVN